MGHGPVHLLVKVLDSLIFIGTLILMVGLVMGFLVFAMLLVGFSILRLLFLEAGGIKFLRIFVVELAFEVVP